MEEVDRYQPIAEAYHGHDVLVTTAVDGPEFWVSAVVLKNNQQVFSTQRSKFPSLEIAIADVKGQAHIWIDQQLAA